MPLSLIDPDPIVVQIECGDPSRARGAAELGDLCKLRVPMIEDAKADHGMSAIFLAMSIDIATISESFLS
jgi:hypothetical protein